MRTIAAGFNWATSFQTWIDIEMQTRIVQEERFQLGHVFSDMDCVAKHPMAYNETTFQLGHVFSDMDWQVQAYKN